MSPVRNIFNDLVDRRLWPVALALVAALVAVPVMLGGGSSAAHAGRRRSPAARRRPPARPRRPRSRSSTPSTAPHGPPRRRAQPVRAAQGQGAPARRRTPTTDAEPRLRRAPADVDARRRGRGCRRRGHAVTPIVPGSGGGKRDTTVPRTSGA